MAPRVVFPVMEPGTERTGLRGIRREFGTYGDIFCASLRLDRFRMPESAEIEFIESKAALKVKDWDGSGSDLALYRADGLIDATRRDEDAAFLCNIDNFGQGKEAIANTFADLRHFATFITDTCSVTIRGAALSWSPGRGVYAQVYCEQKADQERIIGKLESESYLGRKLSVSSQAGSEYAGVSEGGYRVDWALVGSTIQALGGRLRQHDKGKKGKKEKLGKSAKKNSKAKKHAKKKKEKKKEKKKKKGKQKAGKRKLKETESSESSSASAARATIRSQEASRARQQQCPPRGTSPKRSPQPRARGRSGPMALLDDEGDCEESDGSDGKALCSSTSSSCSGIGTPPNC